MLPAGWVVAQLCQSVGDYSQIESFVVRNRSAHHVSGLVPEDAIRNGMRTLGHYLPRIYHGLTHVDSGILLQSILLVPPSRECCCRARSWTAAEINDPSRGERRRKQLQLFEQASENLISTWHEEVRICYGLFRPIFMDFKGLVIA